MNIRIGQPDTGTAYSIEDVKIIKVTGLSSQPIKEGVTGYLEKTTGTDDLLFGTGQCRLLTITADGSDWLIDYSAYTDAPEIAVGDTLRLDIQQPDLEVNDPVTFTQPVKLTGTNSTFTIVQTGILNDLDGATNPILNGGSITVPYLVEKDDRLQITGTAGQTYNLKIILTNSTGSLIDTGQLGAKVIQQGVNGAYYSQTLNKVVILGRGLFDEDEKYIIGDGSTKYGIAIGHYPGRNKRIIEISDYVYFWSYEIQKVIRLNLLTKQITEIADLDTSRCRFDQLTHIGNYLYYGGFTAAGWIDLTTLAYGDLALQNGYTVSPFPAIKSDTAFFQLRTNALNKVVGTTGTYVTVGATASNPIAYHDGYVYCTYGVNVQKIRESDLVIESTITTNASGTVIRNWVEDGMLYTFYTNGTITEIDLSTFVSPARTLATGYSVTNPDFLGYNGHLYAITQNGSSFLDVDIANWTATETPLQNSHNSINVDEVNDRLIFFSQLDTVNVAHLKPVEIIQL